MRRLFAMLALLATAVLPMPATAQTTHECLGETATIVGTEGSDMLWGTTGSDVMTALGGNDRVNGRAEGSSSLPDEGDLICGGTEPDFLSGFGGKDVMTGNEGDDTVVGDEGADRVMGANGSDQVVGGSGHDSVQGGPGNDWRVVDISTGTDELYGNAGNDTLVAVNRQAVHKPDFVDGGEGRDFCYVNEEDETVNCEEVFVHRP